MDSHRGGALGPRGQSASLTSVWQSFHQRRLSPSVRTGRAGTVILLKPPVDWSLLLDIQSRGGKVWTFLLGQTALSSEDTWGGRASRVGAARPCWWPPCGKTCAGPGTRTAPFREGRRNVTREVFLHHAAKRQMSPPAAGRQELPGPAPPGWGWTWDQKVPLAQASHSRTTSREVSPYSSFEHATQGPQDARARPGDGPRPACPQGSRRPTQRPGTR